MRAHRRTRLFVILGIIFSTSLSAALILYALRQNINLFYSPSQIANGEAPTHCRIRIGGMVQKGSLMRGEALSISFVVTDYKKNVNVRYQGIVPDLFREEQGVVASGQLSDQGIFIADEILAKHDENYRPS